MTNLLRIILVSLFLLTIFVTPTLALAQSDYDISDFGGGAPSQGNNNTDLGGNISDDPGGYLDDDCPPGQLCNPLSGVNSLYGFVTVVLNRIVLPIGSIIVVFFIIYAGFLFVTARGNESKLEEAKKTLLAVVIGAAILLGSVAISAAIKGTICQISPTIDICARPPAGIR